MAIIRKAKVQSRGILQYLVTFGENTADYLDQMSKLQKSIIFANDWQQEAGTSYYDKEIKYVIFAISVDHYHHSPPPIPLTILRIVRKYT